MLGSQHYFEQLSRLMCKCGAKGAPSLTKLSPLFCNAEVLDFTCLLLMMLRIFHHASMRCPEQLCSTDHDTH